MRACGNHWCLFPRVRTIPTAGGRGTACGRGANARRGRRSAGRRRSCDGNRRDVRWCWRCRAWGHIATIRRATSIRRGCRGACRGDRCRHGSGTVLRIPNIRRPLNRWRFIRRERRRRVLLFVGRDVRRSVHRNLRATLVRGNIRLGLIIAQRVRLLGWQPAGNLRDERRDRNRIGRHIWHHLLDFTTRRWRNHGRRLNRRRCGIWRDIRGRLVGSRCAPIGRTTLNHLVIAQRRWIAKGIGAASRRGVRRERLRVCRATITAGESAGIWGVVGIAHIVGQLLTTPHGATHACGWGKAKVRTHLSRARRVDGRSAVVLPVPFYCGRAVVRHKCVGRGKSAGIRRIVGIPDIVGGRWATLVGIARHGLVTRKRHCLIDWQRITTTNGTHTLRE